MIKRRFFRVEHADGNDASDSSSSSSDSDSEVEEEHYEETEAEDDDVPQAREHKELPSSPSGYESEDSSTKEAEGDSSDDDSQSGEEDQDVRRNNSSLFQKSGSRLPNALSDSVAEKDSKEFDEAYILKSKSVFKCRLCPKIICLTEESLNTHLMSKRHARSTKLLNEGKLKVMLNSDGEIEEDGETHAERLARTEAAVQSLGGSKKKNKGRQRQKNRLKKKKENDPNVGKAKPLTDIPPNKKKENDSNVGKAKPLADIPPKKKKENDSNVGKAKAFTDIPPKKKKDDSNVGKAKPLADIPPKKRLKASKK